MSCSSAASASSSAAGMRADLGDALGGVARRERVAAKRLGLVVPRPRLSRRARRCPRSRRPAPTPSGAEHLDRVGDAGQALRAPVGAARRRAARRSRGRRRTRPPRRSRRSRRPAWRRGARRARTTRRAPGAPRRRRRRRRGDARPCPATAAARRPRQGPSLASGQRPSAHSSAAWPNVLAPRALGADPCLGAAQSWAPAGMRSRARSMRAIVSSRPSTESDSKIPGETVVPVIATRSGWKTCFGLAPCSSTTARSAASIASGSKSSTRAQRLERRLEQRPRLGRHHLLPRLRVVDGVVEEEADQRPDLGQRLRLLLGDLARRAQALAGSGSPAERGDRRRVLVERQLAHEAAVHPAQLLLVEDRRRRSRRARSLKRSTSSSVDSSVVSSSVPQPSSAR